jgi:hypothetical protein
MLKGLQSAAKKHGKVRTNDRRVEVAARLYRKRDRGQIVRFVPPNAPSHTR